MTIIAGPVLAYLHANGNMSTLQTRWEISILGRGLTALVLYGIGYAGSPHVKIAEPKSPLMMLSGDQAVSARSSITSLNSKLKRMIYLMNVLGALVLFFMALPVLFEPK